MYHQIEIIALIKLALSQLIKKVFQVSKMDLILNSEQKINKMELSSKSKTKLEELAKTSSAEKNELTTNNSDSEGK